MTSIQKFRVKLMDKYIVVYYYPIEFLNSLDLPGLPPHNLQLRVGLVIIMQQNLSQPKMCNGTRLAVKNIMKNLIEATIIIGKF